jgi:sugar (pentulose or hexulose) kinase
MHAKEDVHKVMSEVRAMCVSGTSATCLLLDNGTMNVSRVARIYNFDVLANTANTDEPSKVVSPGEPMGLISPIVASKYGPSSNAVMVGGTTDSNAAFFAVAGAKPEFGLAVTFLGSTVALKQLSSTYVMLRMLPRVCIATDFLDSETPMDEKRLG